MYIYISPQQFFSSFKNTTKIHVGTWKKSHLALLTMSQGTGKKEEKRSGDKSQADLSPDLVLRIPLRGRWAESQMDPLERKGGYVLGSRDKELCNQPSRVLL